ncbi:MAG: hypothetical protein ACUVTD_08300 [Nitrososphaerales archaeon]
MKEIFLLSVGIFLLLFGMTGTLGVVGIYVYIKPQFDNAQVEVMSLFSYATQAIDDASISVQNAANSLYTAADQIDISILGWRPFGATADSLRKTGYSSYSLRNDLIDIKQQIDEISSSIPSQMNTLWLGFTILLVWVATLHILLAFAGVSILKIRKRLITLSELKGTLPNNVS